MRAQLPHLTFSFHAEWVGCGDSANWQHILTIRQNAASAPLVVGVPMPSAGFSAVDAPVMPVAAVPMGLPAY